MRVKLRIHVTLVSQFFKKDAESLCIEARRVAFIYLEHGFGMAPSMTETRYCFGIAALRNVYKETPAPPPKLNVNL